MSKTVNYNLLSDFGKRVEKIRQERGISRKSIVEKLGEGLQEKTYRSWIHKDGTKIDIDHLSKLCDILNCDADYLMGRIDYTTHDVQWISEKTGLSEKAVETLTNTIKPGALGVRLGVDVLLTSDHLLDFLGAFTDYITYHERGHNRAGIIHEDDAITVIADIDRMNYNGMRIDGAVVKQSIMYSLQSVLDKICQEERVYYREDMKDGKPIGKQYRISYDDFMGEEYDYIPAIDTTKHPEEVVFGDKYVPSSDPGSVPNHILTQEEIKRLPEKAK